MGYTAGAEKSTSKAQARFFVLSPYKVSASGLGLHPAGLEPATL
jgi:hypothetical protein